MACGLYVSVAWCLLEGAAAGQAVREGVARAWAYYESRPAYAPELNTYRFLKDADWPRVPDTRIRSSGYVVDTLEAALWCLATTDSYESCALQAVNLGEDTDTVAAVAGGLAGLLYGYEQIPLRWREAVVRREYIEELCRKAEAAY